MKYHNVIYRTLKKTGQRAQAIVEFAIVLPILMMMLVGIFEVGRMIYIYSAVTNASREAARYGSALGYDDNGFYKYKYCEGIKNTAERSIIFIDPVVDIRYDGGPSDPRWSGVVDPDDNTKWSLFTPCDATTGEDADVSVAPGDRVVVKVSVLYSPLINLLPLPSRSFDSYSARTITGVVQIGSGGGGGGGGGGSSNTPTATATATDSVPEDVQTAIALSFTPTGTTTATGTPTSTATGSGPGSTPTSLPSYTPTATPLVVNSPTMTATATLTLTPTATPTSTPTPKPGCDSVMTEPIDVVGNTISMRITNPHVSLTMQDVQVVWNYSTGAKDNSTLNLQYAGLGSLFWSGNNTTGDFTITPSTTVTILGHNTTSIVVFTFNKDYLNPRTTDSITIKLSTPGCEGIQIKNP